MNDPWSILSAAITRMGDRIDALPTVREASVAATSPLSVRFDTDVVDTLVSGSLSHRLSPGQRVLTLKLRHYVWVLGTKGGDVSTVLRLVKTTSQSTGPTGGVPAIVSWDAGAGSPGIWSATDPTRVYPTMAGWWRARAKIRFAASNASAYLQVRMNGQDNPASEGLALNAQAGPYPITEDFFYVSNPGTDYIETAMFSLGANHSISTTNSLFLLEYLGR